MIRLQKRERSTHQLRVGYCQFIARYPWQCFATLTFDRKHYALRFACAPEQADKAFRLLVLQLNERLYGPRWMSKSPSKGAVWVRVQEAHQDGYLHFHALLHTPGRELGLHFVRHLAMWWEQRFGGARVEIPHSQEAVMQYLVKHLGNPEVADLEFSNNFGKTFP